MLGFMQMHAMITNICMINPLHKHQTVSFATGLCLAYDNMYIYMYMYLCMYVCMYIYIYIYI
jgi:hypothetical protein